ncbi:hypothetical protein Tco_0769330 [Tanacetum coccineum]|uniref:Uncharacterized protein n=1 Tax=Tanacetum coccineum TaxID=301880 RepID=A0ABQ4Z948_9ASTR
MSGIVPPISPPLGTNTGNAASPNRVDTIPIDNTTTNNIAQNVEDFSSWKDRFLVYLDGLEPYLLEILKNGPFVPKSSLSTSTNILYKPQKQWSHEDRRLANQDKRLKGVIISCLPNDVLNLKTQINVFKALEGEKVNGTFTRLKCLLNDLENKGVSIPQAEVNATFVNSLPRKWLSMNQTQRANNSIKNDGLATLYGKYNYEEGMIDQIYKSESTRFTIQASNSKGLIFNAHLQDSDSDVEEDTRSSNEFLADLNVKFHDRALLANQKRFYKRSKRVGSTTKPMDKSNETCFACGKLDYKGNYKGLKAEIAILTKKIDGMSKGKSAKALVVESLEGMKTPYPLRMKGLPGSRHSWLSLRMSHMLERLMLDWVNYTHVDLYYVEDQRKNLLSKFNSLNQELSLCKSKLCDLKNTKALNCSLQTKISRLNLDNESLKDKISNLKEVNEKWTSSKVTLDQLLTKQVLGNIVCTLGGRGKRKDTIFLKEVLFTKADESPSETVPEITSNFKPECHNQEPLPPLPKLSGTEPNEDCHMKPKCSAYGSTIHLTKEHPEQAVVKKTLAKLKTKSSQGSSSRKALVISKTFIDCKYCIFNNHHSDECEYYHGCDIYGSIAHETAACTKKPFSNIRKPRIAN